MHYDLQKLNNETLMFHNYLTYWRQEFCTLAEIHTGVRRGRLTEKNYFQLLLKQGWNWDELKMLTPEICFNPKKP